MASKSIGILLPDLRGGGAERVAVNLANGFLSNGLVVEVVLMSYEGIFLGDLEQDIRVVNLQSLRLRNVIMPLVKYLRHRRPDNLLVFMWPLTVIALLARRLACVDTRIVVTEHTTWSRDPIVRSRWMRWLVRTTMHFLFPRAEAIVTVSHGAADDLARFAALDRSSINVIYNPVISERSNERMFLGDELLWAAAEGWWNGRHRRVLAVGALKPIKDYATLLSAFAGLRLRMDVRLLILGEGECYGELKAQVKRLHLENFVFMPGFVRNLAPYYRRADLHVLSSLGEGFGNVLVEALAAGTPVVSTDCQSGPREILMDGKLGTLVPVADPQALAVAMFDALTSSHNCTLLVSRAQEFSVYSAVSKYLSYLCKDSDRRIST